MSVDWRCRSATTLLACCLLSSGCSGDDANSDGLSSPTLGVSYYLDGGGRGFGKSEPALVDLSRELPGTVLTHLSWRSWGADTAFANGLLEGAKPQYEDVDRRPVSVRASELRRVAHRLRYCMLEIRPGLGGAHPHQWVPFPYNGFICDRSA
jgi:hypothetical protein